MDNMQIRIKKWIEQIRSENLEGIAKDIKEHVGFQPDKKWIKSIFKLLLHISHTADKCNTERIETGKKISELTQLLCSILVEVPDNNKFYLSLFHITRCLLNMHLYKEAADVCGCLKYRNLTCTDSKANEILLKIGYLWNNVAKSLLKSFEIDSRWSDDYYQIKLIMENELKIIQIGYKHYTKHLLAKIDNYLEKVAAINNEADKYLNKFYSYLLQYLKSQPIFLDEDDKYNIYCYILRIINHIIQRKINKDNIQYIAETLQNLCDYFKDILSEDEECAESFLQFENVCSVLLQPVEKLTNNTKLIQHSITRYLTIIAKYGHTGPTKWTVLTFSQILEPLMIYWEKCLKEKKKQFLDTGILLDTLNLVACISLIFNKQVNDKCKACRSKDCTVKTDVYNAIVIKIRCAILVSKISTDDLTHDICIFIRQFLQQNISSIYQMKECNCKYWTNLWSTCGTLIYNFGLMSQSFPEESTYFFSLLCCSIISLEGIVSESPYLNLSNPLCSSLHRLSNAFYNNNLYREAMPITALHGLLSYNDMSNSKAFKMWANIKHKSANKDIIKLSMLNCLKLDKNQIEDLGFHIDFSKYDLIKLCQREAKGLQEAKFNLFNAFGPILNHLETLNATSVQYGRVVQLYGYHLLSFEHGYTSKYFEKALLKLKKYHNMSGDILCLEANLQFYLFVNELRSTTNYTCKERNYTKFAFHASKHIEVVEHESHNSIQFYSNINIKEHVRLMKLLQSSLKKWTNSFICDMYNIINGWEPVITLHTLIIAAEYSHLYCNQEFEIEALILAHKLAVELDMDSFLIYITSRSISLRYIDYNWISLAEKCASRSKDSTQYDMNKALAAFWINLADFYFETGKYAAARKLLNDTNSLKGISFGGNSFLHLLRLNTILRNCHLYKEDITHEEYTLYIVENLYAMVNLSEDLNITKWKCQDVFLFAHNILFKSISTLSLRMNSLLSFREISAHLIRRIKVAQTLGAIIRTAELLKLMCFIDLSRLQLNDCEVKLQALEHILDIETFEFSMHAKKPEPIYENIMRTPIRTESVKDLTQNDASPILRKQIFSLPDFMTHDDCDCYLCQHIPFQYLVFSCTHIRAQVYALQNYVKLALEHFHGAFQIRQRLLKSMISSKTNKVIHKNKSKEQYSKEDLLYIIDYVLFLLDFSYFLKNSMTNKETEAANIALLALNVCETNNLINHPIYMSVKELLYESRLENTLTSHDISTFTVPDPCDIDISAYRHNFETEEKICVTPNIRKTALKKPLSIRQNRTPPLLQLSKVSIDYSDNEESTSQPNSPEHSTSTNNIITRQRKNVNECRKKINTSNEKLTLSEEISISCTQRNKRSIRKKNKSMKDVIMKVVPLVPEISHHLYKFSDDLNAPATNKAISRLIEMTKNLKIETNTQQRQSRTRKKTDTNLLYSNEYNMKINKAIETLESIVISETTPESDYFLYTKHLIPVDNTKSDELVPRIDANVVSPKIKSEQIHQESVTEVIESKDTSEISIKIDKCSAPDVKDLSSGNSTTNIRTRSRKILKDTGTKKVGVNTRKKKVNIR